MHSAAGETGSVNVDVRLHQASVLRLYILLILMDLLTKAVKKEAPQSTIFADDVVLCGGKDVGMTRCVDTNH